MVNDGEVPAPRSSQAQPLRLPEGDEHPGIGDDIDRAFRRLLEEEARGGTSGTRDPLSVRPVEVQAMGIPDYLAETPPAIVAVPAADFSNLAGRRAVFSMAKGGDVWRFDIRVISGPHVSDIYEGRPWAWATDEGSWYRLDGGLPDDESGLHCVPLARLWIEEFMTLPAAPQVVDLSAPSEEDLDRRPSRWPAPAPWPRPQGMELWPPPRIPTRAPHAHSLTGRRAIVATAGGCYRDLRAVSEPFSTPATGDLVVALMHERDWYLRWDRVLDAYPVQCVWIE